MLALVFFFPYKWKKELVPVENFPSNILKEACLSGYNTQILDDTDGTFYLLRPQCTCNMKQTLVQKITWSLWVFSFTGIPQELMTSM